MPSHDPRNTEALVRIAVLEENMERLMGNGQPGIIAEMRSDMNEVRKMYQEAKVKVLVFFVLIIATVLAAGNGTVSLHSIWEMFAK